MELFVPALEFIFQSIWHFLGTFVLLDAVFSGIGSIGQVHHYHYYYINESGKWVQFASTKNKNSHEEVSQ